MRTVKFAHPPSVAAMHELSKESDWSFKDHIIRFEPAPVIPLDWPATILTANIEDVEDEDIVAMGRAKIDEYNTRYNSDGSGEDGYMLDDPAPCRSNGKFFSFAVSSLALATWFATQSPPHGAGSPYELAYVCNGNGLKTAAQVASWDNNGAGGKTDERFDQLVYQLDETERKFGAVLAQANKEARADRIAQAQINMRLLDQNASTLKLATNAGNSMIKILQATHRDAKINSDKTMVQISQFGKDRDVEEARDRLRQAMNEVAVRALATDPAGIISYQNAQADVTFYQDKITRGETAQRALTTRYLALDEAKVMDKLVMEDDHQIRQGTSQELATIAAGGSVSAAPSTSTPLPSTPTGSLIWGIPTPKDKEKSKARNHARSQSIEVDQPVAGPSKRAKTKSTVGNEEVEMDEVSHLNLRSSLLTPIGVVVSIFSYPPIGDDDLLYNFSNILVCILACMGLPTLTRTLMQTKTRYSVHIILLGIVILFTTKVTANAMGEETLNLLTLNVNNLAGDKMQHSDIVTLLSTLLPHIVVLTETGQQADQPLKLPTMGNSNKAFKTLQHYDTHHEPAKEKITNEVTLLIHRSVTIIQKVVTPNIQHVRGRVCAVDILIPDVHKRPTKIRIIGIYAPTTQYDPKVDNYTAFWKGVEDLTRVDHEWVLAGDVNAFLHPWEAVWEKAGTTDQQGCAPRRKAYRSFLIQTAAKDLWEDRISTNVKYDWTCQGHMAKETKKILDRVAVSRSLTCSIIQAKGSVAKTNHRPVLAKILTGAMVPNARRAMTNKAPRRLRQPSKAKADEAFSNMNKEMERTMNSNPPPHSGIKSNEQLDDLLGWCHATLVGACEDVFPRRKAAPINPSFLSKGKGKCDEMAKKQQGLNRILRAISENRLPKLRLESRQTESLAKELEHDFEHVNPNKLEWAEFVRMKRNKTATDLRKESRKSIAQVTNLGEQNDFKAALRGGAVKHLFEPHHITNPPILHSTDADGKPILVHKPEEKLEVFTSYFEKLLKVDVPPPSTKPWLESPAAAMMKERTAGSAKLTWPLQVGVQDLRDLMSKGNSKPSPGPDGWEKWALRKCSDQFLSVIALIVNYIFTTNYWPDRLKQNFISPLYKRGDIAEPSNYRGIVFANYLSNLISSHYSTVLQKYAWDKGLIPSTQIAVQEGVQPGDLTTFLSGAHTALLQAKMTAYCCKQDHIKGFDKLVAQGFFDAIIFSGLPEAIVAFEIARTANVTMWVKSQDGISIRFFSTSGQIRQGDPVSPFKYVFAMAMLVHWLSENGPLAKEDIPMIRSVNGALGSPHSPADRISLKFLTVEAMDDSILGATSWAALQRMARLVEQFQNPYGIQTAWDSPDKTVCFTLGAKPVDQKGPNGDSLVVFTGIPGGPVKVPITEKPEILRTAFLDPKEQLKGIMDIIERFPFPANRTMPIALIRRAVNGLLVPRIRARLSFMPLPSEMAKLVEEAMSKKIMTALELRFTSKTSILYSPVTNNGFGMSSVVNINAELAVKSVMRSLNHHLSQYRALAKITMANWECGANGCLPPLEIDRGAGLEIHGRRKTVPSHWLTVLEYTQKTGIRIVGTDSSDWRQWNITHLATRMTQLTRKPVPVDQIDALIKARITTKEVSGSGLELLKKLIGDPKKLKLGRDHMTTRQKVVDWSKDIIFPRDISTLDQTVFRTRRERRAAYDSIIRGGMSATPEVGDENLWATDGSHGEDQLYPTTVVAMVGFQSGVYSIHGQYTSSLHGERLAAIAGLIATKGKGPETRLMTDHLATVRMAERIRGEQYRLDTWRERPGHELYAWMTQLLRISKITVDHIKAHTGFKDEDSRMNDLADASAKGTHNTACGLPPLTGWMRDYVVWTRSRGYIPDNWLTNFRQELITSQIEDETQAIKRSLREPKEPTTGEPTSYFYNKASSGITGKIQLMTRINQFPTRARQHRNKTVDSPDCDLCGAPQQDEKHIFVDCPKFQHMRDEAIRKSMRLRKPHKDEEENPIPAIAIQGYYHETVYGSEDWQAKPWLGLVPLPREPLSTKEAGTAHHLAIVLTSRIAGEFFRQTRKTCRREEETFTTRTSNQ